MKVSIVCPYYNEAGIIEKAVCGILANLEKLKTEWELILVNDGSVDESFRIVQAVTQNNPRVKLVSYEVNQGRGYALRQGILSSDGDYIITTEIDLSWGDDIVDKIINKFISDPSLDVVIASPNIPGGGYKNVPLKRVFLSKLGNFIIRLLFTKNITMNTGMTRGYRREVIKGLPFFEKGKEFHLEVLLKLISLGYKVGEVPATLEWKDKLFLSDKSAKRKSSSKISKLIISHLNFAVFANPIRYFWLMGICCFLVGLGFIINAFHRLFTGEVSVYVAIIGFSLFIVALLFFGFGILSCQNNWILRELWRIQKTQNSDDGGK